MSKLRLNQVNILEKTSSRCLISFSEPRSRTELFLFLSCTNTLSKTVVTLSSTTCHRVCWGQRWMGWCRSVWASWEWTSTSVQRRWWGRGQILSSRSHNMATSHSPPRYCLALCLVWHPTHHAHTHTLRDAHTVTSFHIPTTHKHCDLHTQTLPLANIYTNWDI